jgi:hypothetical protein
MFFGGLRVDDDIQNIFQKKKGFYLSQWMKIEK